MLYTTLWLGEDCQVLWSLPLIRTMMTAYVVLAGCLPGHA